MVLKFDGINMPPPKQNGFTTGHNKIWSKNTRRNDNAEMVGTILAIKKKVEIEWAVLYGNDTSIINSVVNDVGTPYHTISYTDEEGNTDSFVGYFGDITHPMYSANVDGRGTVMITGTKVDFIQK